MAIRQRVLEPRDCTEDKGLNKIQWRYSKWLWKTKPWCVVIADRSSFSPSGSRSSIYLTVYKMNLADARNADLPVGETATVDTINHGSSIP